MGREIMFFAFPRLFAIIRQNPGRSALGLFVLLAMIAAILGLRWADPWGWRQEQTLGKTVRVHWEQANQASDNEDIALAKSHLEAILRICPLNAQAQFLMARTCRRSGDPAGLRHLRLAESLGWPRDQILLERRLLQAESGDTWTVEESLLDELNRLPPEERLILEALVKGYLNNFRFVDAIELTTPWIQRYPQDWRPHLYRGRAYQGLTRWEQAIADFEECLKIRPDALLARVWFADTLLAFHEYQKALDNYEIYRQMVPGDWEVLFAIAECQFSLGRPEARATLDNLLAKHPRHLRSLLLAARMDMTEDAPDKALAHLQQALAVNSHEPDVLQTLIRILRLLNRQDEADQMEKQYRQILDKVEQLWHLKEKIPNQPEDATLRYQAGMLCLEMGQEKEASDWFQSVFWIDPNHQSTHLALADYWAKHGQSERAAYHRRRAEGKRR
jgi:tetratricopeptide (TPR) repeat protein